MDALLERRVQASVVAGVRAIRRAIGIGVVVVVPVANGWAEDAPVCIEKPMSELYGTYVYAERFWYREGSRADISPSIREFFPSEQRVQAFIGTEISIEPTRFTVGDETIIDPYYHTACEPVFIEGWVPVYRGLHFHGIMDDLGIDDDREVIDLLEVYSPDDTRTQWSHTYEVVGDDLWRLAGRYWVFMIKRTARK